MHGFDVVAVGIEQKCRVVGGAVIGAQSGAPVVAAAGFDSASMESIDRGTIGRAKTDVDAACCRAVGSVEPENGCSPRTESRARRILAAEHVAERRKCGSVEPNARSHVLHLQTDVIVHDDLLSRRSW